MSHEHKSPDYETGMKVLFDAPSQRVIVNFRGRVIVLPGSYDDERSARLAGEHLCRQLGWVPSSQKKPEHFRSAWH